MGFFLGSKKRDLSDKSRNGENSKKTKKTVTTPARYQVMLLVTVSIHQNVLKS